MSHHQSLGPSGHMGVVDDGAKAHRSTIATDWDNQDKHEFTSHIPPLEGPYFYHNNCDIGAYSRLNGIYPLDSLGYPIDTTATSGSVHHNVGLLDRGSYHDVGQLFLVPPSMLRSAGFELRGTHLDGQSSEPSIAPYTEGPETSQAHDSVAYRLQCNPVEWMNQRSDELMYGGTHPELDLEYPTPLTISRVTDTFGNGARVSVQTTPYRDVTPMDDLEEYKHSTNALFFNPLSWMSGTSLPMEPSSSSAATASSTEDWYTNTSENPYNTNVKTPIFYASPNGLNVADVFQQQRSAYQGKPPMDRPLLLEQNNQTSASGIGNPLHGLPSATQWGRGSRVKFRARPGHHHPGQRPSVPQMTSPQSFPIVNGNPSSPQFVPYSQLESSCSPDGDQHFSAGFPQPMRLDSGYRFTISTQLTGSRSVTPHAEDERFYDPARLSSIPLQLTGSSGAIISPANPDNLVAGADLCPLLDSLLVSRIMNALPHPLDAYFHHSRPEDDRQLVLEKLLDELSIDVASLAHYGDVGLASLLKSRCEQRLFLIKRGGPRGGLSSLTCSTSGCTRTFHKHNVARDFPHHLVTEHWNIKLFKCYITECPGSFSFPGDRIRHEKLEHDFTYEAPN